MSYMDEILSLRQQLREARGNRNDIIEQCARVAEKFHNPNELSSARILAIIAAIRGLKDKPQDKD